MGEYENYGRTAPAEPAAEPPEMPEQELAQTAKE
jgi:hypothetical protein